jgi:hypothetical protein
LRGKREMCDFCDNDECDHPVSFGGDLDDPEMPEEIKPYIGLGCYLDDLDASEAADDFWENCAHVCHECFNKYIKWIDWWG